MVFSTKNYVDLKKKLGVDNLRKFLLKSANNFDYEVFAVCIAQFSGIKLDEAYKVIDDMKDKQEGFLAFIEELGINGFFIRNTVEELKAVLDTPDIDIQMMIDQIAPDMAREALRSSMNAGVSTSKT